MSQIRPTTHHLKNTGAKVANLDNGTPLEDLIQHIDGLLVRQANDRAILLLVIRILDDEMFDDKISNVVIKDLVNFLKEPPDDDLEDKFEDKLKADMDVIRKTLIEYRKKPPVK